MSEASTKLQVIIEDQVLMTPAQVRQLTPEGYGGDFELTMGGE